jgi:RecA/RadA recombinase
MKKVDKIKKQLTSKPKAIPQKRLSTGSTLLNLACSGKPNIGFLTSSYYYFVGDSASGKSWLTLTVFAEAANNPEFKDYKLIHDNAENGTLMDFRKFFGAAMAERVQPPKGTREEPIYSNTLEEFYYNLDDVSKEGPFIYVLDSMDALTTDEELDTFSASKKSGKSEGTYGTSKAKKNSTYMRIAFNKIRQSKSILVLISQTRDNIGFGAKFNPKTRGGGNALTFYAALEMWTSKAGHLKAKTGLEQGIYCKIRVKKNRLTGRDRTVVIPILHSFGVDETGSMVDWLVDCGHWKSNKEKKPGQQGVVGKIDATDFDIVADRENLVKHIEESGLERDLQRITAEKWTEIEEASQVHRKERYS